MLTSSNIRLLTFVFSFFVFLFLSLVQEKLNIPRWHYNRHCSWIGSSNNLIENYRSNSITKFVTKSFPPLSWRQLMSSPIHWSSRWLRAPQEHVYWHDHHHNHPPFDHAPCLRRSQTACPHWLPPALIISDLGGRPN